MSDQRTQRALEAPVATPEGFISFPAEFRDAPTDLRQVIKIIHRPTVRQGAVGLEFSTDSMVVDFSEVNADKFNFDALAMDCDIVKQVASEHPEELRQLLREMQRGTPEGIKQALRITERIGLTEGAAVKAGGGFFFLIIIAVVAIGASGCGGAMKEKASSATTTPK
jgi:hypothetical protein